MDINIEKLPIIEINFDSLINLSKDKSENRINMLVGKYVILELNDKDGITTLPGKLLKYHNNFLVIRKYDDGSEDIRKLWTDYDGTSLFKDWEEEISINNIRGIEEYKKCNPSLEFKEEYKNCICEITTREDIKIFALVHSYDGFELEFDIKYKIDNEIFLGTSQYPLYFVKDIKVLNELNQ